MTRGLSNVQNTYLAGDSLVGVTFVDIGIYDGTDLHYTDAPFNINYNFLTYEAQGALIGISESQEVSELQITTITLTLGALDLSLLQQLARPEQVNQIVTIYRGFLDPTDNTLIGDSSGDQVITIFKGRINSYTITDSESTATIAVEIKSQFSNFQKVSGRRTNLGSLQEEFEQDWGFEYSHETLRDIRWGKK